jgi:hypothetical protein
MRCAAGVKAEIMALGNVMEDVGLQFASAGKISRIFWLIWALARREHRSIE